VPETASARVSGSAWALGLASASVPEWELASALDLASALLSR
jgi:hypothetical protein